MFEGCFRIRVQGLRPRFMEAALVSLHVVYFLGPSSGVPGIPDLLFEHKEKNVSARPEILAI